MNITKIKSKDIENKRYPIILGILLILATTIGALWKDINKKAMIWVAAIGTIVAWTWQIFISYYDRHFQGWEYLPEKIIGFYIGKVTIEDVFFYPITGILFYFLIEYVNRHVGFNISEKTNYLLNKLLIGIICITIIVTTFIFQMGGQSVNLWFMIPGVIMLSSIIDRVKIVNFIIVSIVILILSTIWDLYFADWYYIKFDSAGTYTQSMLWMDYNDHKWAWIGKSPIEITPYFSLAGCVFIYGLTLLVNKIVVKK